MTMSDPRLQSGLVHGVSIADFATRSASVPEWARLGHPSRGTLGKYSMQINFKALLIFIAFAALIAMATSSNGGTWYHVGEAVSTVVILAGVAGFLTGNRSRAR
jgi:hypothetical protein